MNDRSIKPMLEIIVPRLLRKMRDEQGYSENEALTRLYGSELYRQLGREETKLWHLSVPTLFEMWREEERTGTITYPEEA